VPRHAQARTAPAAHAVAGGRRRSGSGGRVAVREQRPTGQIAGLPAGQVAEIQRSRLLAGAVSAIEEHGYAHTTVTHITARARVSRRTFYELFENREACLAALIGEVVGLVEVEIARAGLAQLAWRERVRGGLWVILSFFDREPALARVCVLQALQGGPQVLALREQIVARCAGVLDAGRGESARGSEVTALTAEGLVGATLGILHARLVRVEQRQLADLLNELMGMIVLPYLGPGAARREQTRSAPAAGPAAGRPALLSAHGDPLLGVPMRLTYRTARVLECIASQPGVSNRGVADHAGIADQGQISKLLARLERLGLVANIGEGHLKGEPNAWTLTLLGERVSQHLHLDGELRRDAA
jgi:AcrR family transcriptional regulator